jgi:hypothetical protein
MAARDPRHTASNLLLGLAGGATALAATVSTTTGAQGPFAAAGLAGLAAGAGLASRVLAVDVERDLSDRLAADAEHWFDQLVDAHLREDAVGLAFDIEKEWI